MAQTSRISGVSTKIRSCAIYQYYNKSHEPKQLSNVRTVRYHSTDVVVASYDRNDNLRIILNTNGWFTATTKTRMNQTFSQWEIPIRIFQKDFQWYIDLPYHSEPIPFPANSIHITIDEKNETTTIEEVSVIS